MTSYQVVVIGCGPAGQQAAIQAARAGRSTLVIEQEQEVGGACVHRGTIPSKTLRETAAALDAFRRRSAGVFPVEVSEDLQIESLMQRKDDVIRAHQANMQHQLDLAGAERIHGRARLTGPHEVEIQRIAGGPVSVKAEFIVIATGSSPRNPNDIVVDHQHILDSDSILSLIYLPESLLVLGAGVIACEYATIFAHLGCQVTVVDRGERPLGFLDPELSQAVVDELEGLGGRFVGGSRYRSCEWNGDRDACVTMLEDGQQFTSAKVLFALGRSANIAHLALPEVGIELTDRGLVVVDHQFRTTVPSVYAVGDVIGPPALACTSMDQGRRAICHAFDLPPGQPSNSVPSGIYTIPELACIGLDEAQATARGGCIVGRAPLAEIARGQISANTDGLLKIVCDAAGRKILGIHVIGDHATELSHIGQMAMIHDDDIDVFIDHTFNFPTLAEAYRLAALDVVHQRGTTG